MFVSCLKAVVQSGAVCCVLRTVFAVLVCGMLNMSVWFDCDPTA